MDLYKIGHQTSKGLDWRQRRSIPFPGHLHGVQVLLMSFQHESSNLGPSCNAIHIFASELGCGKSTSSRSPKISNLCTQPVEICWPEAVQFLVFIYIIIIIIILLYYCILQYIYILQYTCIYIYHHTYLWVWYSCVLKWRSRTGKFVSGLCFRVMFSGYVPWYISRACFRVCFTKVELLSLT